MNIYLKKLHPNAVLPKRGTLYAGGWDVTAVSVEQVAPDYVICHLGFALQLPAGFKLMLQPRSNIVKHGWIMPNSPGLADPDYFGEYTVHFRALPENTHYAGMGTTQLKYPKFPYKAGERIAQCYLEQIIDLRFHEVEELNIIGDRKPVGHEGTTGL